jgi:osmotically-inducible protein OsmY
MRTDQQIQIDTEEELKWEPLLHGAKISVVVNNGAVTLCGTAIDYQSKLTALQAATRVRGVKSIISNVEVCLPSYDRICDEIICIDIYNALRWHCSVPSEKISVKVQKGIVTLKGEVDQLFQKVIALNAMKHLRGIKDIIDLILVKSHPDKTLIATNVHKALERRAGMEDACIIIETVGNKVTLKGTVHSWEERAAAAHAARTVPGVESVVDEVVIDSD